jgi:hypothetical protein
MSDQPVFIDGPLKGRADLPIDGRTRAEGLPWIDAGEIAVMIRPDGMPVSEPIRAQAVLYKFFDVAMFTHMVLVGSVAVPPGSEALFEALASDQAKASARPRP